MLIMLTENIDVVFAEISISAIQKSVNLYSENFGEETGKGLDSLRLLQVPFALMILGKQKSSRFSRKLFAGAADETEFEPEAPASVTCFSMNFTRWSSENSRYTCQPHIMGECNKLEVVNIILHFYMKSQYDLVQIILMQ